MIGPVLFHVQFKCWVTEALLQLSANELDAELLNQQADTRATNKNCFLLTQSFMNISFALVILVMHVISILDLSMIQYGFIPCSV